MKDKLSDLSNLKDRVGDPIRHKCARDESCYSEMQILFSFHLQLIVSLILKPNCYETVLENGSDRQSRV